MADRLSGLSTLGVIPLQGIEFGYNHLYWAGMGMGVWISSGRSIDDCGQIFNDSKNKNGE